MLDPALRRLVRRPLELAAGPLVRARIGADAVTLAGFAVGLAALPLLAFQLYGWALAAILANRVADGLDGAIAQRRGATDLGGYLDIVCDFVFYAAVPLGFALARPENALPAAFLIFSFVGTGTSFLAFAALAARRGLASSRHGPKSIYYLGGLTEGGETILLLVTLCLLPGQVAPLAWGFGALCWVTTFCRVAQAVAELRRPLL